MGLRLAFVLLGVLAAGLPADLFLTQTWVAYLDAMRNSVRSRPGVIAVEDTLIGGRQHELLVENWVLTSQSLLLRGKPSDGRSMSLKSAGLRRCDGARTWCGRRRRRRACSER